MKRLVTLGALVFFLAPMSAVDAQFAPGARSVGMGGGGMVFANGVDAVELNPANLAFGEGWNLSIAEAGWSGLLTGVTIPNLMTIFADEDFSIPLIGESEGTAAQVIAELPAEGVTFSTVSEGFLTAYATEQSEAVPQPGSPLPSIGLSFGNFGLRVRSRVMFDATVSKELMDLIGNGFVEQNIQSYRVGNTGFNSASFSEITASYGTTLGGLLSIGVGGRYVMGHSLVNGMFFEPVLDLISSPQTLSLTSVAVEATSGTGYGLDIGLSLDLPMGFRAAVSGTNVIQRMNWDESLTAHTAVFDDGDFDAEDFIDLLDLYQSQPVSPTSVSLPVLTAAEDLFEESYFPATLRAGLGWQAGGTSIEAVATSVSPRGRHRNAWDERIGIGIEQRIPLLTLRAGIAQAEDNIRALTGGFALRLGWLHIDAGAGLFEGTPDSGNVYEGAYGTVSLQLKGGGAR